MRIALVVHYFSPHIGGMEEVVKKQANSLISNGHKVTILTCRPFSDTPLFEQKDGYEIRRIRALNFVEKKFGVTFPLVSPFLFFRFLKEFGSFDAVHIHDVFYMTSHAAAFAAKVKRIPLYLTQHVAMVEYPRKLVMVAQRLMYTLFGMRIFHQAKWIVCYNTNVRDFLVRRGVHNTKILLNYNGIDINYFSPVSDKEKQRLKAVYGFSVAKPVILFAGRLVPKKGFDKVYNARSSDYTTVIVGTGSIPPEMEDTSGVVFFGGANHVQLRELYRLSDVFVFPAVGEILTLVMQEAMASGLPIVTTNDPAYKNYNLNEEMMRFVPRNAETIRQVLTEIIANPEIMQAMSGYSRQIAEERFSWAVNYAKELQIYNDILEGRK